MTATPKTRAHLVERAVEAMSAGGAMGLGRATPPGTTDAPPAADATTAPATPGTAPAAETPAATPRLGAPILGEPVPPPRAAAETTRNDPTPDAAPEAVPMALMQAAGLVALTGRGGRTRLSEELAVVQQQVLRTMRGLKAEEGRASRVVLVTSARPGEGKTFTALNLAAAIATGAGYPTLLVDGDGKHGSISDLLGHGKDPGLHAMARDTGIKPADIAVPTAISRLSLVPFGSVEPATEETGGVPPGTLLAGAVLRLATAFPKHVIILDSPPCLAASDPGSLAAVAGQVLVVVQAEKTQRNEVEAALDMVESCPVLQLVLNQTRMTMNDSFGAYGYGAYGGYGATPPAAGR